MHARFSVPRKASPLRRRFPYGPRFHFFFFFLFLHKRAHTMVHWCVLRVQRVVCVFHISTCASLCAFRCVFCARNVCTSILLTRFSCALYTFVSATSLLFDKHSAVELNRKFFTNRNSKSEVGNFCKILNFDIVLFPGSIAPFLRLSVNKNSDFIQCWNSKSCIALSVFGIRVSIVVSEFWDFLITLYTTLNT